MAYTVQDNHITPLKTCQENLWPAGLLSGAQLFVLNHNNRVFIVSQRSAPTASAPWPDNATVRSGSGWIQTSSRGPVKTHPRPRAELWERRTSSECLSYG
jgi:hypothetical protein